MKKEVASLTESEALAKIAVKAMQEKKTSDIVMLDLRNVSGSLFDFFVVGTGNSPIHLNAIEDEVEMTVKKMAGVKPVHREGRQNAEWIVLDYADVIVHVFQEETREFYQLEALWADAERIEIPNEE